MSPRRLTPVLLLLLLALLLPACSSTKKTTDDEPEPLPEPAEPEEPAEPAEPEEPAEPSEPARARTVQGFRIQVLTTEDKGTADQRAAELESQYQGTPVEVAWKAPYYRVRLGAFASRSDAQSMLSAVKRQYPGALLIPDTVTIQPD